MPPFEDLFLLPLGIVIGWLFCVTTISRLKDDLLSQERTTKVLQTTLINERKQHDETVASLTKLANQVAFNVSSKLSEINAALIPKPTDKQKLPFILVEDEDVSNPKYSIVG